MDMLTVACPTGNSTVTILARFWPFRNAADDRRRPLRQAVSDAHAPEGEGLMATSAVRPVGGEPGGLAPVAARFALAAPHPARAGHPPEEPAGSPVRPFGLRLFKPAGHLREVTLPPYRYCPVRQVAVTTDEPAEPLIHRLVDWDRTTTGQTDGKDRPQEEWTMDYLR
jgi:putative ATP-grasp target RiPP